MRWWPGGSERQGPRQGFKGLVLAWWAETIYKVWSRTYSFVRARLPWQPKTEVENENEIEVTRPKRVRHQQAAIDARNDMI